MKGGATQNTIVAYWLIPAEPARSNLSSLISNLAARFDGPIFEPHLTIYVTNAENENARGLLERALVNRKPYRLAISGFDYTEDFTKTVFVQFKPNDGLSQLSDNLRCASTFQNEYELNPHLSLIYKTMDRETKRDLAASLRLPFTEVLFDSMKAVISPAKIESREDVDSWRVVATRTFAQ